MCNDNRDVQTSRTVYFVFRKVLMMAGEKLAAKRPEIVLATSNFTTFMLVNSMTIQ